MIFKLIEKNLVPDFILRIAVRALLSKRLRDERKSGIEKEIKSKQEFIKGLKNSPIAVNTSNANEQHYEVPSEFYLLVLGKHLKYSSGFWPKGIETLEESEAEMLRVTCERADIQNGQTILDLGCGWGSLSLYIAGKFPKCKIVSVSNSKSQKQFIDSTARQRGLNNIRVITMDMNEFTINRKFDRIVSVEMLEHMKNYEKLFSRISAFLKPKGLFFVHIFCHRKYAYHFEVKDSTDWMAKYFFTGGMMPSDDLFLYFQSDLRIIDHWRMDGKNYSKTCEAWLRKMDQNDEKIIEIFSETYGKDNALKWLVYWRIFFISCAELFAFRNGQEWFVSHYLFRKK
ncbi:MAG: cyclopropane-fatty-acyl-phospholipid synthase family protein [Leptospira sp.]|nr:cyclopropane-fatty-acyl-phospholipid synthase family protein [Leptospira sp.]